MYAIDLIYKTDGKETEGSVWRDGGLRDGKDTGSVNGAVHSDQ